MDISSISSNLSSYQTTVTSLQQSDADSFQKKLEDAAKSEDDPKLMEACEEFESYFIQMMYSAMRKTVPKDENSLFPKSQAEDIFQDMLDEEHAKNASKGNGIGLAETLYKQLTKYGKNTDIPSLNN